MRIGILGGTGRVGRELHSSLKIPNSELVSIPRASVNEAATTNELRKKFTGFDVVINAAAFTNVDECERRSAYASEVNGYFAGRVADSLSGGETRLLHISTDFVFEGNKGSPYALGDKPNPINTYGQSKLLGEKLVQDSGARFSIFRTAWIYGEHGSNFPKWTAEQLLRGKDVHAISDVFGSPTWTLDLVHVLEDHIIKGITEPTVHAVSSGTANRYQQAMEVLTFLISQGKSINASVKEAYTNDFDLQARRPKDSRLENKNTSGLIIGDWRERWNRAAPIVLAEFLT